MAKRSNTSVGTLFAQRPERLHKMPRKERANTNTVRNFKTNKSGCHVPLSEIEPNRGVTAKREQPTVVNLMIQDHNRNKRTVGKLVCLESHTGQLLFRSGSGRSRQAQQDQRVWRRQTQLLCPGNREITKRPRLFIGAAVVRRFSLTYVCDTRAARPHTSQRYGCK